MHIRKQKKLTYRIGVPVVLASMMFLAEGAHGIDLMQRIVTNQYEKLMKERETVYAEEKKTLEQELEEKRLTELSLKSVIGGAEEAPIVEEVKKLVGIVQEDAVTLEEALGSLNENLQGVPGPTLVGKVEALKEALAVTQEEKVALEQEHRRAQDIIREIERTTGGSGTGTPLLPRLQGLRDNSEVVKGLEAKLRAVPGDSLGNKIDGLMTELAQTQGILNVLAQKLYNIPGDGLSEKLEILMARELAKEESLRNMEQAIIAKMEKLEILMAGRELVKEESLRNMEQAIIAKEETINDLKESLEDKEETINDLYVELLTAQSEATSLDVALSQEQVAHSEKSTQLNQLLEKQFNRFSRE